MDGWLIVILLAVLYAAIRFLPGEIKFRIEMRKQRKAFDKEMAAMKAEHEAIMQFLREKFEEDVQRIVRGEDLT